MVGMAMSTCGWLVHCACALLPRALVVIMDLQGPSLLVPAVHKGQHVHERPSERICMQIHCSWLNWRCSQVEDVVGAVTQASVARAGMGTPVWGCLHALPSPSVDDLCQMKVSFAHNVYNGNSCICQSPRSPHCLNTWVRLIVTKPKASEFEFRKL